MRVGIIGYGEIGKAVEKLYTDPVAIKDLDRDDGLGEVDVLHICFPFGDRFQELVSNYISEYQPQFTVIHSTVPPTTTEALVSLTGARVVHSPVRGVHPELLEGLLTFDKYVGADFECADILEHFSALGIKTKLVSSRTSELAKLMSTTYYGVCIAWHGEMKAMCDSLNINYDEAVTDWNTGYNAGYDKLNMPNVVRPVLYPPTKIGGHCVVPNAELLKTVLSSQALDLVLKYK